MVKLNFYIPENEKGSDKNKSIWEDLEKVKSLYDIEITKQLINKDDEEKLKSKILWTIAVFKRIKIHQSVKGKSLYPQLIVFFDDEPFTFYDQTYGKEKKITIKDFLDNLIQEKVLCLHDEDEFAEKMKTLRK